MRIPLFVSLLAGCASYDLEPRPLSIPATDFFTDISESSGIQVGNFAEDPVEGTVTNDHSRLAFADITGDGFDDIVMHSLFPNPDNGVPFEHLVFVNNGDGTFRDHSDASGLRDVHAGFFAFADVDNDGDQDLFAGVDLAGIDTHAIYLNDGDGVFHVKPDAGVESARDTAANAVFADVDNDGILDLFVGHGGTSYLDTDRLYIGVGDGTFRDESERLADQQRQPSNGSVTCDYDNDGDADIVVSTYSVSSSGGLNHLWQNDGTGTFTNVAVEAGFASLPGGNYFLGSTGNGEDPEPDAEPGTFIGSNGFGIDCADVNGDGWMDIFLTAISHPVSSDYNRKWSDPSQLLINQGPDAGWTFTNEWQDRGLPFNEGDVDGGIVDIDNDGRLDLSISRDRKYESNYDNVEQKSWFGLLLQQDSGDFTSLGHTSGVNGAEDDPLRRMKGAQNHAWSDVDGDGDLDLLVGGRDQGGGRPNFLFRNDIGHENRWLQVDLVGDGDMVNSDAIGARVTLRQDDTQRMREVRSSRGMYNSEDSQTVQLGLDGFDGGAELVVTWPDGTEAVFKAGTDFGDDMRIRVTYPDVLTVTRQASE
ncbi:MAG: hypothetical protein ACJARS_004121 [bacterium]|jgi:hypothetical protein